MLLKDGTVIPSVLSIVRSSKLGGNIINNSEYTLRLGYVTRVYQPTDENSVSKQHIEYDVVVDKTEKGNYSKVVYPRARVASLFGGVGDYVAWTPRFVPGPIDQLNLGSQVLILCLNGNTQFSYIVGGIPHPTSLVEKDLGHNYRFEFNGANTTINKDGEWSTSFKGATDHLGALLPDSKPEYSGSLIKLDKNGSVLLNTPEETQFIKLIHGEISAMEIQADTSLTITCNGPIHTNSEGVYLGGNAAHDSLVMGTTYRANEQELHNNMISAFEFLHRNLVMAGQALTSASATVPGGSGLAMAGGNLIIAAGVVERLKVMIQQFESNAASYLSKKNFTE